ncbi:BatA domain-containing protein, partial [Acidobacteriota bacterium]
MHFMTPAFLAGIAGAALPILIHLMGRRKPRELRFPAVDFILRSSIRMAAGLRLKRILLLLLRVALVIAVALALARPYVTKSQAIPAMHDTQTPLSIVILLDTSFSMGFQGSQGVLLDKAKERALAMARGFPPGSEVACVVFSDGPDVVQGFENAPYGATAEIIGHARLQAKTTSVFRAIERARTLLQGARNEERRIVVLTDLTAFGLKGLKDEDLEGVVLFDVSEGEDKPNIAVTDVRIDRAPGEDFTVYRIEVKATNFSARPVRDIPLSLRIAGKHKAEGFIHLDPFGTGVKRFHLA